MSDTGDRRDNFPENKTEFSRFNKAGAANSNKLSQGEWRSNVAQGIKRFIQGVRHRKTFPRAK